MTDAERIAALEAALREACEVARSRDTQQPWCRYCGRTWSSADHLAGPCRIGRGLGVLGRERQRPIDIADPHPHIEPPNPWAPSHFAAPGFVAFYPPMPGGEVSDDDAR